MNMNTELTDPERATVRHVAGLVFGRFWERFGRLPTDHEMDLMVAVMVGAVCRKLRPGATPRLQ